MATITIKYDDGSVGEWTKVSAEQAGHIDDYLLTSRKMPDYHVISTPGNKPVNN